MSRRMRWSRFPCAVGGAAGVAPPPRDAGRAAAPLGAAAVGGVLGEVPGAELGLGMRCGAAGVVAVEVHARAGEATTAVAEEMAAVLESVAETTIGLMPTARPMRLSVEPRSGAVKTKRAAHAVRVPTDR